jgi:hypothetical protein
MKTLHAAIVVTAAISVLAMAGLASAARPTVEYYFYDCEGDGPSDFAAVKTGTPEKSGYPVSAGSALDLTDGSGTYQILSYGEGNSDPDGIRDESSSYNLVCEVDYDEPIGTTTVYGNFVWTAGGPPTACGPSLTCRGTEICCVEPAPAFPTYFCTSSGVCPL